LKNSFGQIFFQKYKIFLKGSIYFNLPNAILGRKNTIWGIS